MSHKPVSASSERAIAQRLESIRTETGYGDSLRAFWKRLAEDWEESVSYEAARRYHWKREPPISYLARVVEVFPEYRLEWLATGEGAKTRDEEEERLRRRLKTPTSPLLDAVAEQHPWLLGLSIGTQETFVDVLRALERQTPGGPLSDVEEAEEERLELADDLVFLLTLPLQSWGFISPHLRAPRPELDRDRTARPPRESTFVDTYFRQMLGAFLEVVKTHQGDRVADRPGGLLASLRRSVKNDTLPEPSEEEQERVERIQAVMDERMAKRDRVERIHAILAEEQERVTGNVGKEDIEEIMAEVEAQIDEE